MIAKSTVSTLSKQISLFQHFKADQNLIGWAKKTVSEPEHFFILTDSICDLFATLLPLKRKGAAIAKWLLSKSGWQVRRCRLDLSGCIVIDDVQFGIFAWDMDSFLPSSRGGSSERANFGVLNSSGNSHGKGNRMPSTTPLILPQNTGFHHTRYLELCLLLWRGKPAHQEDATAWGKRHGVEFSTGLPLARGEGAEDDDYCEEDEDEQEEEEEQQEEEEAEDMEEAEDEQEKEAGEEQVCHCCLHSSFPSTFLFTPPHMHYCTVDVVLCV